MSLKGGNSSKNTSAHNARSQLVYRKIRQSWRCYEWYSRGYLPHRNQLNLTQHITFRLADSLPKERLRELEDEKKLWECRAANAQGLPREMPESEQRKRIENWLDSGMGCCALKHPDVAKVMQETLLKSDNLRYHLLAWCIMPNHVHVLIEPLCELGKIVQSWKSFTGRWAMDHAAELGLSIPGKRFWMREYWDRYIRNGEHLVSIRKYIHNNPVKAQLCSSPEDWAWSSAHKSAPSPR